MKPADLAQRECENFLLNSAKWLTDEIESGVIFLPNFNIMRANRPNTRENVSCHGGVMIAVNNEIKHHEVFIDHLPALEQLQNCGTRMPTPNLCHLALQPPSASPTA